MLGRVGPLSENELRRLEWYGRRLLAVGYSPDELCAIIERRRLLASLPRRSASSRTRGPNEKNGPVGGPAGFSVTKRIA